jgi:hypothetical protein
VADTYEVGNYHSESEEKTLVRAFSYGMALYREGLSGMRANDHVVLGGLGGDIRVLLAMGVPHWHIHVAETSYARCRRIQKEYPLVSVYHEDVLAVLAKKWKSRFLTVNLDLCKKLSNETIELVSAAVGQRSTRGATFFVTLCNSREREPDIRDDCQWLEAKAGKHKRCAVLRLRVQKDHPSLRPVADVCYTSRSITPKGFHHGTAMCTTVFGSRSDRALRWRGAFDVSSIASGAAFTLAFGLKKCGLKAPAISQMLRLPRQQVAGWFAAETRLHR